MNRYPSTDVSQWHEQKRRSHTVETAKFKDVGEFDYYLDDFAGLACDNLVQAISCEDPESGIEPIITVSSRIPERLRPYFALHEYIEFHTSQLESEGDSDVSNAKCWEIERFVLAQFTDLKQVRQYVGRRIDMFEYIDANFGRLTEAMVETARYLKAYDQRFKDADDLRRESRQAYKQSQHLAGLAMEAEAVLRAGDIRLPTTPSERSSAAIATFLTERPQTAVRQAELEEGSNDSTVYGEGDVGSYDPIAAWMLDRGESNSYRYYCQFGI